MSDSTGYKINAAVMAERRRWATSQPSIRFESGVTPPPHSLPTMTIVITGGDAQKLQALGTQLLRDALSELANLKTELA